MSSDLEKTIRDLFFPPPSSLHRITKAPLDILNSAISPGFNYSPALLELNKGFYDKDIPNIEDPSKKNPFSYGSVEEYFADKIYSGEIKLKNKRPDTFQRIGSFLTELGSFLLDLLDEGVPYPFSDSLVNKIIWTNFVLNEEFAFTSKFDFILLDPNSFISRIKEGLNLSSLSSPSFFSNKIKEFYKSFFNNEFDVVRKIANIVFYLLSRRNLGKALNDYYKFADAEEKKIIRDRKFLYLVFMYAFYDSIMFRFYLEDISDIKLPEVKAERVENMPLYYFTEVTSPESVSVNFIDNKKGSIIRFLEEWRDLVFYRRGQGLFLSDPSKGYVFRNNFSRAKRLGIILPLAPRKFSKTKFLKKHIHKRLKRLARFFTPSHTPRLLYPKIALYDMYPTSISFNEFSNEGKDLLKYSVTFSVSDIEVGRII